MMNWFAENLGTIIITLVLAKGRKGSPPAAVIAQIAPCTASAIPGSKTKMRGRCDSRRLLRAL